MNTSEPTFEALDAEFRASNYKQALEIFIRANNQAWMSRQGLRPHFDDFTPEDERRARALRYAVAMYHKEALTLRGLPFVFDLNGETGSGGTVDTVFGAGVSFGPGVRICNHYDDLVILLPSVHTYSEEKILSDLDTYCSDYQRWPKDVILELMR